MVDLMFLSGRLVGMAMMIQLGIADNEKVAEALRSVATEVEQAAVRERSDPNRASVR